MRLFSAYAAVVGACFASPARAATYDFDADPSHHFRIWAPDDVKTLRGALVHFNASGDDDRALVDDASFYESYVRTLGFAFVATFYETPANADSLTTALRAFARMSGRPELASAPVLAEGLSLGGYSALQWAMASPERTLGYVNGATRSYPPLVAAEAQRHTPGLHFIGEEETDRHKEDFVAGATAMRRAGHQAALYLQRGVGHKWGQGLWVGRNFLAACYALRYAPGALADIPDASGWLLDPTTYASAFATIGAAAAFKGDPRALFWAPSEDIAMMIRGHATREKPLRFEGAPPGTWSPLEVEPGQAVPVRLAVDPAFRDVVRVRLFDGASPVADLTAPPYAATWRASRPGAHGLVAVASDAAGAERTGLILPIVVAGRAPAGGNAPDAPPAPSAPSAPSKSGRRFGCNGGGCSAGAAAVVALLLAARSKSRRRGRRRTRPTDVRARDEHARDAT